MKKVIIILVGVVLVGGLIFAYTEGRKEVAAEAEADKPLKAASRVEVVHGENIVTADAATRANSGIALAPLEARSYRPGITAYGTVVDLGEISDLRNTLAAASAQVPKANVALTVAKQEYERVKALFDENQNVAQKTVQAAEGVMRTEEANVRAAQAALDAARSTARQRWGSVVADWVVEGGAEFDRLRRQEVLLIQMTLTPAQGATVAPPQASVQLADGRLIAANLVSPASRTDPKIQGPSYFYLIDATGGGVLPGMNVTMLLPLGDSKASVLVPSSAVIWLQGKPWVYVQVTPDHFVRREVSTEQPTKEGWVQKDDFPQNGSIVVRGAQLLLSEELRAQITVGD